MWVKNTYNYSYRLAWHTIRGTVKARSKEEALKKAKKIRDKHLDIYSIDVKDSYILITE